jgi:DNA modification methylase
VHPSILHMQVVLWTKRGTKAAGFPFSKRSAAIELDIHSSIVVSAELGDNEAVRRSAKVLNMYQVPEELYGRLIVEVCDRGDSAVDLTCGTGSFAVSAARLYRINTYRC